jgi:DNA-binding transcriptional LysR family regulator
MIWRTDRSEVGVTLDQVRIFVAVAEREHVTHAAEALNLAQSAASHAIASLEDRHQTKLFNRIGRHIELTDAGKAFLKEARAVLAAAEAAELALMEFRNLKRGVLSVQASHTIANYWLPRHLAAFRSANPQIEIRANIGNTARVATAVENRETEAPSLEAGLLQQIDFRLPEREFYVLTHRDRHPSRAARAFLEMLADPRTTKRSRRSKV